MTSPNPIARLSAIALLAALLPSQEPGRATSRAPSQAKPSIVILTVPDPLAGSYRERQKQRTERRRKQVKSLAAFARKFIRPKLSAEEDIKSLGSKSVVALIRPEQHVWLQKFLARFEAKQGSLFFHVECKFYEITDAAYRRAVQPLLQAEAGPGRHAVLAGNDKTNAYLAGLEKLSGSSVLHAPKIASLPIQETTMSMVQKTSFVEDFKPTFDAQGDLVAVDPVISAVHDGMILNCTCGLLPNGVAGVDMHAKIADLHKPIPRLPIQVRGWQQKLEIQVPEVDIAEVTASVRMPVGGAVLFELPDPKRHLLVALRIHTEEK